MDSPTSSHGSDLSNLFDLLQQDGVEVYESNDLMALPQNIRELCAGLTTHEMRPVRVSKYGRDRTPTEPVQSPLHVDYHDGHECQVIFFLCFLPLKAALRQNLMIISTWMIFTKATGKNVRNKKLPLQLPRRRKVKKEAPSNLDVENDEEDSRAPDPDYLNQ
ncbi:unnamed protein product [Clavelina lepadiformis]|uniref:Uncharacterized protein n=1 Tax=Clavelina lepadiformis TaxID=159417 RepID=A0ABP0F7R1_CLALP